MSRNRGFTLVELLVVVAIIAILAAFLLGSLSSLRSILLKVECASNLSKISKVFGAYADESGGLLPCFGTTSIYEKANGAGATPKNRHLMIEALTRAGATAKVFSCPAHARREDIDSGDPYYSWEIGRWRGAGSGSWQKYYSTPGYVWFAHSNNFTRHPSGGNIIPNHWSTWSRFYNGSLLPERNDSAGNPPICADIIYNSGGGLYGFWHDLDRETPSGNETDEQVLDYGTGGHTLFLSGDVVWGDWGELEKHGPGYEIQDNKYAYFFLEKPDN